MGVGNDNTIKSELLTASPIFVVAEKSFLSKTSLKIFKEYKLVDARQAHLDLEARKINGPAILVP